MLARRAKSIALLFAVLVCSIASTAWAQGASPAAPAQEPDWLQHYDVSAPLAPQPLPPCLKPSDEQFIAQLRQYIERVTKKIADEEKHLDRLESDNTLNFGAVLGTRNFIAGLRDRLKSAEQTLAIWTKIPRCKVEPPPPPPPPPAAANPWHRATSCLPCQWLADKYNEAADKYREALRRHDPDQADFLADMQFYATALGSCEEQCRRGLAVPLITPGTTPLIWPYQTQSSPTNLPPDVPPPPPPRSTPRLPLPPGETDDTPAPQVPSPTPAPTPANEHGMAPQAPGTRFYAGLTAGGATGSSKWKEPKPATSTDNFALSGALGGGTLGWQGWNGPVLYGVEADISGGTISGSTTTGCSNPCRTSNTWLGTVRGRAGYSLGEVTPYVTGGLALGDVNAHVGAFPGAGTTQAGYAAGAGLQFPLGSVLPAFPGATGKLEYLHIDLGSPHICTPATCGGNANVNFTAEVFRLGINIPFAAPPPP